jgi:hypothetical protein
MAEAILYIRVSYDPGITDPEALASAADRILETATTTPDILDDYGNPKFGEFFCLGQSPTKPVCVVSVKDPDTKAPVAVEIRKVEDGGHLVGIDASYLEQDVGPVFDPLNFGVELEIPDDET